jgi:NADPH:quinone reductase
MRAVTVVEGDRVEVADRADPVAGPGEIVVRVAGAGLNRADLMQRAGFYPAPPGSPPDIPGLELSGVVESIGVDVDRFGVGDAVFGIAGGGGQAERLAVPAVQCAPAPEGLDLVTLGGVPEVFVTAHDALVTQAAVQPGEWVLVHAVGSGVGTAATQLCAALGARVVGTARTADKIERCRPLGLETGIVPPTDAQGALDAPGLADAVLEATGGHGADVAIELVGGPYVEADLAAMASHGRIVVIGTLAGGRATMPLLPMMQRRLTVRGTVLRARTPAEKGEAMRAFERDVVPMLVDGRIAPVVDAVLPLERAIDAYELLASNATFGKVILACDAVA